MQDISVNWSNGDIRGEQTTALKTLGEVRSIFHDQAAAGRLPDNTEIYRVQVYAPIPEGTEGGLYWGSTTIQPGRVGDEYYMTKGHFHLVRNRGEYYATVQGIGTLLLMGEDGQTRSEEMRPGSVHYIPGHTAHRVANTGSTLLTFAACWPSDAGHDYETIERGGFGALLVERNGRAVLVPRG